jgi:hypothetical protein
MRVRERRSPQRRKERQGKGQSVTRPFAVMGGFGSKLPKQRRGDSASRLYMDGGACDWEAGV